MSCKTLPDKTIPWRNFDPNEPGKNIYVTLDSESKDNCTYKVFHYCGWGRDQRTPSTQVQLTPEESNEITTSERGQARWTDGGKRNVIDANTFHYDCDKTCELNDLCGTVKQANVTCRPNERYDRNRTQYLAALNKSHPCVIQSVSNPELCVRQGIAYTIDKDYGYCNANNQCDDNIIRGNKGTVSATFSLKSNGQVEVTADNGYKQFTQVMPAQRYDNVLRELAVTQQDMDTCKKNRNCETQKHELKYKGKPYVVQCSNTERSSKASQAFACPTGWIPSLT